MDSVLQYKGINIINTGKKKWGVMQFRIEGRSTLYLGLKNAKNAVSQILICRRHKNNDIVEQ